MGQGGPPSYVTADRLHPDSVVHGWRQTALPDDDGPDTWKQEGMSWVTALLLCVRH